MNASIESLSEGLAQVVESAGPSIVRIEAGRGMPSSGIAWSEDLVVTVHHAIEREEGIEVGLADGKTAPAALVGRDPSTDVAVLRVSNVRLTPARPGDAAALRVGHLVLALGRPGRSVRALLGMATAIGPEWRSHGGGRIERYVQLSVDRQPGFSGGAVVDARGDVVGMGTAGLMRGTVLAVPASTLKRVVEAIVSKGNVQRGYLGVGIYPVRLPQALAQQAGQGGGAMLISVQPGGAADKAGLQLGDVLLSLDGHAVTDPRELISLLDEERVGQEAALRIARGGQVQDVRVTVGTRG